MANIEFITYKVTMYEPTAGAGLGNADFEASLESSLTTAVRIIEDVIFYPKPMGASASIASDLSQDGNVNLNVSLVSSAIANASLLGFATYFGASVSTGMASSSRLSGYAEFLEAAFTTNTSGAVTLLGMKSLNGVTLCTIVRDALNLWGIEKVCNAPDFAIARAIDDVNAAMQAVWNQADDRDYWTKSSSTVTFTTGVKSMPLPIEVQNVVGPCRLSSNRRQLAIVRNISELENFMDVFMDGQTSDEPIAYFVERTNQAGDDPVNMVLHVTPAPAEDTAILLDVVLEAPHYYVHDLLACPILPIPHRYAESLLLPIVRYKASSFWLFENHEAKPSIDRDYQMAMAAIGAADPLPGKPIETKSEK
jgi:hypothetical protein